MTLYQLCTGQLPQSTDHRPIHVACTESDAPEDLSRLLLAALDPDPLERLASADHVRRGLAAILAAHPRMSSPRHLFAGSYDRLEVLGVGASAVVYRASDRALSRQVALKNLKHGDDAHEDDVIRFRRAARVLSAVRHPSIPQIFHTGIHDGQLFAVTELCSGAPATTFVRPDKHLRPDEVITVGMQLAGALAAVHAAGVVYRDLHPGNVLVARGDSLRAWLFDFDQAQVSPEFYAALTGRWDTPPEARAEPKRETPLHKMDYASPEVRTGAAFSTASDVYALGLLLYRLLTGKRPFLANSTEPISPRKLCPACPRGLDGLLLQMLSPEPNRRPALAMVQTTLEYEQAELAAESGDEANLDPPPPATARSEPAIEPPSNGPVAAAMVAEAAATSSARPDVPAPQRRSRPLVRLSALAITASLCFMAGRATVEPSPDILEDPRASAPVHVPEIVADQATPVAPKPSTPTASEDNSGEAPSVAPPDEITSQVHRPSRSTLAAQTPPGGRRRGAASSSVPSRGPTTNDEAQHVAGRESLLTALQGCANVPGTIIAELEIERGHGTVAMLNRHTPNSAVSWHSCARTILEALEYPASVIPGRVRVRLPIQ